jgi:hypothetical protein
LAPYPCQTINSFIKRGSVKEKAISGQGDLVSVPILAGFGVRCGFAGPNGAEAGKLYILEIVLIQSCINQLRLPARSIY